MGRDRGWQRAGAGAEEAVSRPALLDSSFLIDLERETAAGEVGPARAFLSLRGRPLVVSIVTIEELLEGAADEATAVASLQRFSIQGQHFAQAQWSALLQRRVSRRLGENDAWLVATVDSLDADVVGADRGAFVRLGRRFFFPLARSWRAHGGTTNFVAPECCERLIPAGSTGYVFRRRRQARALAPAASSHSVPGSGTGVANEKS